MTGQDQSILIINFNKGYIESITRNSYARKLIVPQELFSVQREGNVLKFHVGPNELFQTSFKKQLNNRDFKNLANEVSKGMDSMTSANQTNDRKYHS